MTRGGSRRPCPVWEIAGIDVSFNEKLPLDTLGPHNAGALSLSFSGTWLDDFYSQATPNSINRDCTGYYSVNCTNPRPKWKSDTRLTYPLGMFDASVLLTHLSAVSLEPYNATAIQPLTTPQGGGPNPTTVLAPFRRIPAYDYFDLSLNARVGENLASPSRSTTCSIVTRRWSATAWAGRPSTTATPSRPPMT